MMLVNLLSIQLLFRFVGLVEFEVYGTPKKFVLLIALVFFGLNYFLFMHSEKYKLMAREYEKEDSKKRNVNTCFMWLYITLSLIFLILLMVLNKNKHYS